MEAALRAAAMWWADQIFVPVIDHKITRRDGTDLASERVEFHMNAVSRLFARPQPLDKKTAFEEALFVELVGATVNSGAYATHIDVDYDPCRELYDAAVKAGCPNMDWPSKHRMRIERDGTVKVAAGYGAPWEVVWDPTK